jgi:hypothetical protein
MAKNLSVTIYVRLEDGSPITFGGSLTLYLNQIRPQAAFIIAQPHSLMNHVEHWPQPQKMDTATLRILCLMFANADPADKDVSNWLNTAQAVLIGRLLS